MPCLGYIKHFSIFNISLYTFYYSIIILILLTVLYAKSILYLATKKKYVILKYGNIYTITL